MTNLTEKWKNGELENGWYFVKLYDRLNIVWLEYTQQDGFFGYYGNHITNYEVEQILAPVPSYAEYMILVSYKEELTKACKMRDEIIKKYEDIDSWWQAENQKLKELLKECKPYVIKNVVFTTINKGEEADLERNILLTKIDEVLE